MAIPIRAKDDLLTVRGVTALGVIALGVGQPFQIAAIGRRLEDVQERIEVPYVAATLARLLSSSRCLYSSA